VKRFQATRKESKSRIMMCMRYLDLAILAPTAVLSQNAPESATINDVARQLEAFDWGIQPASCSDPRSTHRRRRQSLDGCPGEQQQQQQQHNNTTSPWFL
jgi:hypothetical protein